jgi:hypothetical protein
VTVGCIHHYHGDEYFPMAQADTLTSLDQLREELDRLNESGVTNLVLHPSSSEFDQVQLLAEAVRRRG